MTYHTVVAVTPAKTASESASDYSALLLLPLAAVAFHHYTKKQMRKAKHKMLWQLLKLQLKALFSFKKGKKMRPITKGLLILVLSTAIFWALFGPAVGAIVLVVALLFLAIYGSEL